MKKYKIKSLKENRINVCGKPLISPEDTMIVTEKTREIKNLEKQKYISIEEIKE